MENNQKKNESITSREQDFAQWYTDVCKKAELMDYSSVKGFINYLPYGYAIWEEIQSYLNSRFKASGHTNVYLPSVIPESLFQKEKDHVVGFAPETLVATIGGNQPLEDRLILRPTSEVLFCDLYSRQINSYRDLPKLYNQWCSVIRWEKTTRPFLRGSEFLWQEGHTMHENEQEARTETLRMLDIYDDCGRDMLAIPFIKGRKTNKEKFAGAEETYTIEALMPDGKALQSGTSHYFGDGFAKAFNIKFLGRDGAIHYPHQTSWGVSTRLLGAIIMVHGDNNGLVLPPRVAPIQAVIIPVAANKPGVIPEARKIYEQVSKTGLRIKLDESDKSAGWKFSEYEMRGVPIRIEVGPRDIANGVVTIAKRNTGEKITVKYEDLNTTLVNLIDIIHNEMYLKASDYLSKHVTEARTLQEMGDIFANQGGYAKIMWCGDESCELKVKETYQATARAIPFNQISFDDKCAICGKPAKKVILFAKAY